MARPIENYALLGDMRTAALVADDGSVDWLCLPRFDSGSCFAALLGTPEHGRWRLAPADPEPTVSRRYRDGSLILETTFTTKTGTATVIDFMPVGGPSDRASLVRLVRGDRGFVDFEMDLALRFDYGAFVPWVRRRSFGITAVAGPNAVEFRTPVELTSHDFRTTANFTVRKGDCVPFHLLWRQSHVHDGHAQDVHELLDETQAWWEKWSARCHYRGAHRDLVLRSLAVLKALTCDPTGGIVAAPTTSLPEKPGGVRNWDYRYCWLRDATFTLYSLLSSGYEEEAANWQQWLLRAVAGKPSDLQIMYGVAGERLLPEIELSWLPGYESSVPVRLGNAAHHQFQLDVYGEVMDCFHVAAISGIEADADVQGLQQEIIAFLEDAWKRKDEGLWEVRGPQRHFTHSKVMAWVAVDRAVKAVERYGLDEAPVKTWRALRDTIHKDVCEHAFDSDLHSFVQYYGAKSLDASLLLMPQVGFLPAHDRRVRGTVAAIERHLLQDGLVHRYSTSKDLDGLPAGEAAFLACSFWLADAMVLEGRQKDGRELFNRLAGLANDVGLLSEEYDPVAKRMLGNFPQAFSHVALVNTAHNLQRRATGPARRRSKH